MDYKKHPLSSRTRGRSWYHLHSPGRLGRPGLWLAITGETGVLYDRHQGFIPSLSLRERLTWKVGGGDFTIWPAVSQLPTAL